MGVAVFAYPSDHTLTSATLTMTNENATYPATNGNDLLAEKPLKATTTSTVITMTHSGNVTAAGFAIINHNLVGATVTLANPAGYSQTITIPARTSDGQCVNAFRDMRSDANRTDDVWTLTITGASANVAIGELVMVSSLRDLNWIWGNGNGPELDYEHPHKSPGVTFYGKKIRYDTGVRIRSARGTIKRDTDRSTLLSLAQSSKGQITPWLFVPDVAVNDAWWVCLSEDSFRYVRQMQNVSGASIAFREESMGLVL